MQHLTRGELKKVLNAIPDELNRTMVLVAFWHGLRASEVVGQKDKETGEIIGGIKGRDIQNGHVKVKRLKGSMATVQPFVKHDDPDLDEYERLTALAELVPMNTRVFQMTRFGFNKLMKRAGKKAGIPAFKRIRPHILKHSIAMQLVKKKVGIEIVRQRLGHTSIASTGHYLIVDDDEAAEAVAEAMK